MERIRRATIGTAKKELINNLFKLVKDKKSTELQNFLSDLDKHLILELPSLFDDGDSGKNLIHKCA